MRALRIAVAIRAAASPTGQLLGAADVAELRRQVTRTANPCGCKSGAVMVIIALIAWPAWRIASGLPRDLAGAIGALALWGVAVVTAAVVGKLGGVAVGRRRHRRLRRQLDRALAASTRGR